MAVANRFQLPEDGNWDTMQDMMNDTTQEMLEELNIDMTDIEEKYTVHEDEEYFEATLMVDGLPVVDQNKESKLMALLRDNLFAKVKAKINDKGQAVFVPKIHNPEDESKFKTKGYMFIEFENAEQANAVLEAYNGYKMDKQHTLAINKVSTFDKVISTPENFTASEKTDYKEKGHLKSWLLDPKARNQFILLANENVQVFWNNQQDNPSLVHSRPNWTESHVRWSTYGSYLATFHSKGSALWAGPSWDKFNRYPHLGVKLLDFSNTERYMTTWSNEADPRDETNLKIWDVVQCVMIRGFPTDQASFNWPVMKWSAGDKYVARPVSQKMISVYELPSMKMLDNKSIKVDQLSDFAWSPSDQIISFWTPEMGNNPARVTLMELPSRNVVRTKNLFNVTSCKFYWQSDGDYLCVKVDRHTKSKKVLFASFEIFCLREKQVPVEVLEIKDTIVAFAWEPKGDRFAIITAPPDNAKNSVSFYRIEKAVGAAGNVGQVTLLHKVERKAVNSISWSPKGRFCILADLADGRTLEGGFELWDVEDLSPLSRNEHYGCSDIEWDPTGRYIITSTSFWRVKAETAYMIWDFKGQLLYKLILDRLKQILWRPHPPILLSKETQKQIRKNLKEYSVIFDREDEKSRSAVSAQVIAKRRQLLNEWSDFKEQQQAEYHAHRDLRAELRGGIYEDEDKRIDNDEVIEELIEELISEEIEEYIDE